MLKNVSQTHLQDKMKQYVEILKAMKDYDKSLSKERVSKVYIEKERRRLEVSCIKVINRKLAVSAVYSSDIWLNYLHQLDGTYLTNNCHYYS